ncbi:MAG: type III pantothenate kinase [Lentisphaeria bacterium]|jgi:type III pantothenate kinase
MSRPLLLNIGNTHTQIAAAGLTPEAVVRIETARLLKAPDAVPGLAGDPRRPVVAACVVPDAAAALRRAWPDREFRFITAELLPGLDFSQVAPRTLGADRLANAVAALTLVAPPVIVLDCGTALSSVAIDAARRFRGGAILPGRRLLRLALHRHTGQLPDVPMADTIPHALGTCTTEAILAGTDLAAVGAIQHVLDAMRRELGAPDCPVLATGGDAPFFRAALPWLRPAPEPFTLRGIAQIAAQLHFRHDPRI